MAPYKFNTAAAILALSVSVYPLAATAQEPAATTAAAQPAPVLPSIFVTKASMRPLVDKVVATGSVRAVEEIYVQPQVEGLSIKSLEADVGDTIQAGAILARLSDDALLLQKSQFQANRAKAEAALAQYRAQLTDAKISVDEAERQRVRAQALGGNGTFSKSQVEQATTAADSARAKFQSTEQAIAIAEADIKVVDTQVDDVDLKLARTDVKATVGGQVSARSAKVGAIASGSGQPLFTLIREGKVELVADVSESDILRIKPGQKAQIAIAGGAEKLSGTVRLVAPTVDPQTRLGSVHISVDGDRARAGMYASAEIVIQQTEGVSLPLAAITTNRSGSSARKVADGVVKQVEIKTGIQDGGFVQVVSGLQAGDLVVAKAGAFVRDGDRIKPVSAETN